MLRFLMILITISEELLTMKNPKRNPKNIKKYIKYNKKFIKIYYFFN